MIEGYVELDDTGGTCTVTVRLLVVLALEMQLSAMARRESEHARPVHRGHVVGERHGFIIARAGDTPRRWFTP